MYKTICSVILTFLLIALCGAAAFAVQPAPGAARGVETAAAVAPVSVSIPSVNVTQGTAVTVPITVGDLTGRGAISYDFEVRFDPTVLRPVTASPTTNVGTLSSNFTVTANPYLSGRLIVSGFSAYPLTGQGTLLNLHFDVIGATGTSSALSWQSFMFNEGDPPVTLSVGGVTVGTNPVAVTLPATRANTGAVVTVPVTVGDLTGRGAISYDFEVRFDPAVLRPVAATPTTNAGTLSANFTVTANPNLAGRLLVSGFSAFPLTGQGTLLNLNFEVVGQAGASSALTWQSFMFNEGSPASTPAAGQFTVNSGPRRAFDFDGDGKADLAVFRPGDKIWYRFQSTAGFAATPFGLSTDKIAPADYDGDGKTDLAVFRDGLWYWYNSASNTVGTTAFGAAGDVPVPADYSGDGRAELAVFRSGVWYVQNLATGASSTAQFGLAGDKPLVGDYDGDGKADQAVFRGGQWHLNRSTLGYAVVQWGLGTDKPLVGDFDGDGKADPAVFRNGVWYVSRSTQGFYALQFGLATDVPIPADFDGDGKTDVAVFRNGVWYAFRSQLGFSTTQFGTATDRPIPAAFIQ